MCEPYLDAVHAVPVLERTVQLALKSCNETQITKRSTQARMPRWRVLVNQCAHSVALCPGAGDSMRAGAHTRKLLMAGGSAGRDPIRTMYAPRSCGRPVPVAAAAKRPASIAVLTRTRLTADRKCLLRPYNRTLAEERSWQQHGGVESFRYGSCVSPPSNCIAALDLHAVH